MLYVDVVECSDGCAKCMLHPDNTNVMTCEPGSCRLGYLEIAVGECMACPVHCTRCFYDEDTMETKCEENTCFPTYVSSPEDGSCSRMCWR